MHVAAVASRRTTSLVDAGAFPWQLAAFGRERLETSAPDLPDEGRARQRLQWWTELAAFRGPEEDLNGKLRPLGMAAGQLAALLGEREDDLSQRLIRLPLSVGMPDDDVDQVVDAIENALKQASRR